MIDGIIVISWQPAGVGLQRKRRDRQEPVAIERRIFVWGQALSKILLP